MSDYVRRFTLRQIIQHFCVMVLFILLALTGFPQKFSEGDWARWIIQTLGGIDQTRWLHRYSGILFAALVAVHVVTEMLRLARVAKDLREGERRIAAKIASARACTAAPSARATSRCAA